MKDFFKFVKNTWLSESIYSLCARIFSHYFRYIFHYKKYYLLEHHIFNDVESEYLPKLDNYDVVVIQNNEDAKKLFDLGYNFRSFWLLAKSRLAKGGVAICVFCGKDLVNIGWIALTEESKCIIDRLPYYIDFKNEACLAGSRTHPNYRKKGLMRYNEYHKYKYLFDKGIKVAKSHIEVNNIHSKKAQVKFNPKIYAKARYLVLFGWKSWKEIGYSEPISLSDTIS